VVERLAAHARAAGAVIETGAKVDRLPDGPVIVAVGPRAARALLPGADLTVTTTATALLDVGLAPGGRRGPSALGDTDEGGFATRPTATDPSLAPTGHDLVQALLGLRPGEPAEEAGARLDALVEVGWPGWRERAVWERRMVVRESSGAVDLPGTTWRDRPAIDQGGGVWLAGDWVATPGHLAEVSCASAVTAATAVRQATARTRRHLRDRAVS
jgi:phytoene dehydrogenase-like protein